MRKIVRFVTTVVLAGVLTLGAGAARAADEGRPASCKDFPSHAALRGALEAAQAQANGGFGLQMWATVVNRDGVVCGVAFTGNDRGDQWPGSRVISAQKANTANAFSLPGLALSTANLYSAVQPGGTLFGLQASNPVDTGVAYGGPTAAIRPTVARATIPWWADESAALTFLAAGWRSTMPAAGSSAASASAATHRVRTTTSHGGRATP